MPVHVYGNPCDVDAIESIAEKYNLKVIYDASHAFGVKCHCGSILNHGDLSVLSFHATKVFNTFEGGAIISKDEITKKRIDQLKNFGFKGEVKVDETGINGKMNEFSAALGLLQLKQINNDIKMRRNIDQQYRKNLKNIQGITCFSYSNMEKGNYSYFPIFVVDNYLLTRDQLYERLNNNGINGRRYFYPLITDFPMYKNLKNHSDKDLLVAKKVASKVICLPIYDNMKTETINFISNIISNK